MYLHSNIHTAWYSASFKEQCCTFPFIFFHFQCVLFNNVNCEHYTVSVINDLMSVELAERWQWKWSYQETETCPSATLCTKIAHRMARDWTRILTVQTGDCLPQPWHNPTWMSQAHIPCRPHFVTTRFPHFVNKTILNVTTCQCPAQTAHSMLLLLGHINMNVTSYRGVVKFCCKWGTVKQCH